MQRTIDEPLYSAVPEERRKQLQEAFGRHLVENRNRLARLIRDWIETDKQYPTPIYDRLIDRIRKLDPQTRTDVASISLLMADEMVSAILSVFSRGDYDRLDAGFCNYVIVAQVRGDGSHAVTEEVDINRGKPVIPIWDEYKRWLSRYAPSELRA